jgi:hypothetical protein
MTSHPRTQYANGTPPDSPSAAVNELWRVRIELANAPIPSQSGAVSATARAATLAVAAATALISPTTTLLPLSDALLPSYFATPVESSSTKAQEAIALLDEWLNDDSGYDAQTWPQLKKALDEDRLSDRKLFDG